MYNRLLQHTGALTAPLIAKAEEISWQSRDGLTIYGVLFRPLNYENGKKYPLQMMVHGGPESADVLGWNNWYSKWPQIMAQKGAFVLMPNYRGSTGRGVEYAAGAPHAPAHRLLVGHFPQIGADPVFGQGPRLITGAHQRGDGVAFGQQQGCEVTADEAGRPGHEIVHADILLP